MSVVMAVARDSDLIVGAAVLKHVDFEPLQCVVDELPPAKYYCSDRAKVYEELW